MDEQMADASRFSVGLSTSLHSLGINGEILQFRKSTYLKMELLNVFHEVTGYMNYITGSQVEGTTTLLLYPDIDEMMVRNNHTIINNVHEWRPNQDMLLLINNDVHPGYVKLKSLDPPLLSSHYLLSHRWSKGGIYFSSRDFVRTLKGTDNRTPQQQHGPAVLSGDKGLNASSSDGVPALRCSSWPLQAIEWLTRERHHNWPTEKHLTIAEKEGCLLVPVGFTGSPDEDIEWRFSFSLLERELVWSWNDTQRQCLVFLKFMVRNYLNKKAPDVLSSYHIKTLMFWMVEETPFDEWVPENLTKYIIKALAQLLQWVQVENCPSYFIRENNLFDGKLECPAKLLVIESIQTLIDMGIERYLVSQYEAKFDIEGMIVQKLNILFGNVSCIDKELVGVFVSSFLYTIINGNEFQSNISGVIQVQLILNTMHTCLGDTVIEGHNRYIMIGERFLEHANNVDREIMQLVLNSIHSSLGSHLFAKALQTQDGQTRDHIMSQALSDLELGQHVDIASGRLKLATCYYINGDYQKALDIVSRVLGSCGPHTMLSNSLIPVISHQLPKKEMIVKDMYQLKISPMKTLAYRYAFEVRFLSTEEPVLPRQIKYEFLAQLHKESMAYVAVDPVVYAHFLQCSCHFHTKQTDKLLNALQTFHGYVKRDYKSLYIKPRALNLLAHCCIMAGKYKSGLNMLAKSMKVCPDKNQNGAPWILGVFVYDFLRSRGHIMEVNQHVILYSR